MAGNAEVLATAEMPTPAGKALNTVYLELIDLALTYPVGDYRDGVVRASQHVLARSNDYYGEAANAK